MAEIIFGGGGREIGGPNLAVVRSQGQIIAADSGLGFRSRGAEEERIIPDFRVIDGKLLALLITHAHLDHTGAVPCVFGNASLDADFEILMNMPTWELSEMHWSDTLRISDRNKIMPPFFQKEIDLARSYTKILGLGYKKSIGDFKIQPISVGHILGAQGYYMETPDGKRIFIAGDFSLDGYSLVKGFAKEQIEFLRKMKLHALIIGSTYAGRELPDKETEETRFQKDMEEFLKQGRRVLIPAFAIDRAQKLSLEIKQIPNIRNYFVDGNARRVCKIYNRYTFGLNGIENHFVRNGNDYDAHGCRFRRRRSSEKVDIGDVRAGILRQRPLVVAASSGMVFDGSASSWYANELIEGKDAVIAIVGYQAGGSPGREILESKLGDKIFLEGQEKTMNAEVKEYRFTAHAREHEIAELIDSVNAKMTIFYHGEYDYIRKFLDEHPNLPGKMEIPPNGKVINI